MMMRVARQTGSSHLRRSAAEDRDDRGSDGSSDVHRAGIIRKQNAAQFQKRAKLAQGGLARKVQRRRSREKPPERIRQFGRQRDVGRTAEDQPATVRALLRFSRRGEETFGRPAFGGSVFGAR